MLILCCSILPTSALTTDIDGKLEMVSIWLLGFKLFKYFQDAEVAGEDIEDMEPFMEVSNSSILEEEHFNTTEHSGFLNGFVESLSVILVIQKVLT